MTTVFISWSGETSQKIAELLRDWIPSVLQFAKPYYTPNDIEKGTKWSSEINDKLSEANVGIVCLTKENVEKPWILFEAGALSKDLEKSKVCSVLFGLESTDISGPLATFQSTLFNKSDFKKMMAAVNDSAGASKLAQETFSKVFEKWWPELQTAVEKILTDGKAEKSELRTDRELLEEILALSRSNLRTRKVPNSLNLPAAFVVDFIRSLEGIVEENAMVENGKIQNQMNKVLMHMEYLAARTSDERELAQMIVQLRERNEDFIPF